MLDITFEDKKFLLYLDSESTNYTKCRIIVEGLLSTRKTNTDVYSCSFNDLTFLKKKLDMLGLSYGRTMTIEAQSKVMDRQFFIEKNNKIKNGEFDDETRTCLAGKLKTELYSDQLTAVSYLYHNQKAGNWDEMGMGKTLCSLATIVLLGYKAKKSIVICPKNVTIGFEREVYKHTHLRPIVVPPGRKKAFDFVKEKSEVDDWDIMMIHPENLISPKTKTGGTLTGKGEIVALICSMPWDVVIIDEFHMYKDETKKRTKCVIDITRNSKNNQGGWPRVIAMTGTPVSESPLNAYMVLRILGYGGIPSMHVFKNHFCVHKLKKVEKDKNIGGRKVVGRSVKVVEGYKNLDELKFLMDRISIRRTKDEMSGFPDKIVSIRDIYLSGKQLAMYKLVCGEIMAEISQYKMINIFKYIAKSTAVLRLRQLMNHPNILEEEGESAKYLELDSIVEEVLSNRRAKIVIWTEFRKAVENLVERYKHYGSFALYGGVEIDNDMINNFEMIDGGPKVVVAIPSKAGVGTDWLARARTSVYVDRPYAFTLYKQSMDRIHRRVDDKNPTELDKIKMQPANLMFLDVYKSVDHMIRDLLTHKGNISDAIITSDEKLIKIGKADLLQYLR